LSAFLMVAGPLGGCASTLPATLPPSECGASDESILEYAQAASRIHGVEFLDHDAAFVELYRHEGRLGYIASRYVDESRSSVELHRELIIWM
jgi:hypothetical protein